MFEAWQSGNVQAGAAYIACADAGSVQERPRLSEVTEQSGHMPMVHLTLLHQRNEGNPSFLISAAFEMKLT